MVKKKQLKTNETNHTDRILSLDVVRGFALLGILLINILAFGAISAMTLNPPLGFSLTSDIWIWGAIELTAEGAMRALFSMLFGAGVLLFLERGEDRGKLHFKRTFWLLIFGLINGYVLMWLGDILFTYALAGFILYFLRNMSAKGLAILSVVLFACLCAYSAALNLGLEFLRSAANQNAEAAAGWAEFYDVFAPSEAAKKAEIAQRTGSFLALMSWSAAEYTIMLLTFIPMLLVWDALVFMCIGMALYRYQVLQGAHSDRFYLFTALAGFGVGLTINAYEIYLMIASDFDILETFPFFKPTYQLGRLGVALGWLGVLILAMRRFGIGRKLAAVGRMALTNYLMQSLICLFIFSGIGFGLLGELRRTELYIVVLLIWAFQLWLSPWWLARFRYGPAEWLWRALTYGKAPPFSRRRMNQPKAT